jgi:hypothetical protein
VRVVPAIVRGFPGVVVWMKAVLVFPNVGPEVTVILTVLPVLNLAT